MASADIKSIGLFIDGNYFKLIDKGLKADGRRVNVKGLKEEISFQMNINSLIQADPSLKNFITEAASL